jgi:hypothetical protein
LIVNFFFFSSSGAFSTSSVFSASADFSGSSVFSGLSAFSASSVFSAVLSPSTDSSFFSAAASSEVLPSSMLGTASVPFDWKRKPPLRPVHASDFKVT